MKRSALTIFILSITGHVCLAQSQLNETISVSPGQNVKMDFPFTELVNIRGWEGDQIEVRADVLINMGKNDDAYQIITNLENGTLVIEGDIRDYEDLPEMIKLKKDGEVYYFETDNWNSPELQKFYEEEGREGILWVSHGVAREIELEIKVPQSIGSLEITSKFGLIDIEDLNIPVVADSKHGGVDLAISETGRNNFILDSKWGIIYTNLDLDFNTLSGFGESDDWSHVECSINGGGGSQIELVSKHGNIYLRKQ